MLKLTRWTIAHRRFVVAAWVVLAVGVLAVSQTIGKRNANNFSLPNTGSQHAIDLLQSHFPAKAGDVDQIVFRDRTGKLDDHSARARDRAAARADRPSPARHRRGQPLRDGHRCHL